MSKLEEIQEAINQQKQLVAADIKEVHARVTADVQEKVSSSHEAVRALADEAAAIRQEVQEARSEATQRERPCTSADLQSPVLGHATMNGMLQAYVALKVVPLLGANLQRAVA